MALAVADPSSTRPRCVTSQACKLLAIGTAFSSRNPLSVLPASRGQLLAFLDRRGAAPVDVVGQVVDMHALRGFLG